MGGDEGDLLFGELLGKDEPPQAEAGLEGGANLGDGERVHICWHVAHRGEQPRGLLFV